MRYRAMIAAVLAAIACCGLPAGNANASTQVGETFTPDVVTGVPMTFFQTTSPGSLYTVPSPGVLTSWRFRAASTPPPSLKLKVAHPAGGNDFTILGESGVQTPIADRLNEYHDVRIPVQPGDVIGFFAPAGSPVARAIGGYAFHNLTPPAPTDPPPGSTNTYSMGSNIQAGISASLEPDVDGDGFGDETQDCAPNDPARAEDCTPPNSTITEMPKDKTTKKTATFGFTSNKPGSSFQCSVDGRAAKAFSPCTSPFTVKVKKGVHNFQVRAIDAVGNVETTPAEDDWKVKKKRKKK
jgi:hypothetical protein